MNKRIREAAIIAGLVGLMITAVVFATPDPYALRMNNNDTSGYHTISAGIHSDASDNLFVPGDITSGSTNVNGQWTFYTVSNKSLTIGPISALTSNTFVRFPDAFNGLVKWSNTAAGGSNVVAVVATGLNESNGELIFGKPNTTSNLWAAFASPWTSDSTYNAEWVFGSSWVTNSLGDPQPDIITQSGFNISGAGAQVKTNMPAFSSVFESNWQNLSGFSQSEFYYSYQYPKSNGTNLAVRPFGFNFQRNVPGNTNYFTQAVFNSTVVDFGDPSSGSYPLRFQPNGSHMSIAHHGQYNLYSDSLGSAFLYIQGDGVNANAPTFALGTPNLSHTLAWAGDNSEFQITENGSAIPLHFYSSISKVMFDQPIVHDLAATGAAAPTIASASTIAPTKRISFVSGTTGIDTITAPSPISATGGEITLIPKDGAITVSTSGNVMIGVTMAQNKACRLAYDSGTAKWYVPN